MNSKTKKSEAHDADLQSSLSQIETLIDTLENNDTSLEESLSAFEKGIKLTRSAQKVLAGAEQKVQTLLEEGGEFAIQKFSEEDIDQ